MEKKLYQITITVNRGEQIKKMDTWGGTVDPFIKVMLGNIIQKTKVISNNINPVWNQIIKVSILKPSKLIPIIRSLLRFQQSMTH